MLGFLKKAPRDTQISVPQGYNASRYENYTIFYNSKSNYNIGIVKIEINGSYLKVYELERSICDIIKNENRFDKREYNKLINYYFNKEDINTFQSIAHVMLFFIYITRGIKWITMII